MAMLSTGEERSPAGNEGKRRSSQLRRIRQLGEEKRMCVTRILCSRRTSTSGGENAALDGIVGDAPDIVGRYKKPCAIAVALSPVSREFLEAPTELAPRG